MDILENKYIEVKTNNEITNLIKVEIQEYSAVVIEPSIKYDYNKTCEVEFEYNQSKPIDEFVNNISSYIDVLDKLIEKRNIILNSLYNDALQKLINWEEADSIDINNINNYVSVNYITLFPSDTGIEASVKASAWDYENEEELLGGHFIEAFISIDGINENNITWNLS